MFDVPIVLVPIQRRYARVQEPEYDEIDYHVEKVPSMTQTQS